MRNYIVIGQDKATELNGTQSGSNVFHAIATNAGTWVVDQNAANEFPEAFTGLESIIELNISDFPSSVGQHSQ